MWSKVPPHAAPRHAHHSKSRRETGLVPLKEQLGASLDRHEEPLKRSKGVGLYNVTWDQASPKSKRFAMNMMADSEKVEGPKYFLLLCCMITIFCDRQPVWNIHVRLLSISVIGQENTQRWPRLYLLLKDKKKARSLALFIFNHTLAKSNLWISIPTISLKLRFV